MVFFEELEGLSCGFAMTKIQRESYISVFVDDAEDFFEFRRVFAVAR